MPYDAADAPHAGVIGDYVPGAGLRESAAGATGVGPYVHMVVMDGAEKLLFGYDKAGRPLTYTR